LANIDLDGDATDAECAQDDRHVYCFFRKRRDSVFKTVSPPDKEKQR